MEIKKGISQMAEYPNAEVNYVVPADGKMYYVLRDGVLANGCVIATLDPKRAVDSGVACDSIGVFKEDGSVLIDFDKKDIKKINEDNLLVVNSIPKTEKVINALKNMDDEISKTMMRDNSTTIVDKMMVEMGITGEILFSDAYSEANVYQMDELNHKIGPDSSFIGKNDKNFFFHTNDSVDETVLISLTGEVENEPAGFTIPDIPVNNNVSTEIEERPEAEELPQEEPSTEPTEEIQVSDFVPEEEENQDLKLDISQNILDGFKPLEENKTVLDIPDATGTEGNSDSIEIPNEEIEEHSDNVNISENFESESGENDEVLDNVIEVMKKMIEETNKLNDRITELEEEIEKKNNIISSFEAKIASQESKKNTLSDLLDEANEVLDNIDEKE